MKRSVVFGGLLGLAACLVLVWVVDRPPQPVPTSGAGAQPNATPSRSEPPSPPMAPAREGGTLSKGLVERATPIPQSPALSGGSTLQDIDSRLKAMQANGRKPDLTELDTIFAQLQAHNGGQRMMGGVDLHAVRQTLQAAARIQQLNEQLKPLAAEPSEANLQKIQAIVQEMRTLQGQMDVGTLLAAATGLTSAGTGSAAPRAPTPASGGRP